MEKNNFHFLNIYANRFLGDMLPILPILPLLLLERGFTLSTISLFFLCLSVTVLIAEIPVGVLADMRSPRLVVIASRLFKLLAFGVLLFAVNIYVLCLAGILWGLASALDSGAMQSYLFQLSRQYGREEEFESVYGKTFTAALLGLLLAGLIASQISILGFVTLQYIGIGALTLCFLSVLVFPPLNSVTTRDTKTAKNAINKNNFRSLFRLESALILLLAIGIFAGGIKGSLDEYTTLLLVDKELAFGVIGYIVFGLEVLRTSGAAVAARFKLTTRNQLAVLAVLGVALITAAVGNYFVAIAALMLVILIDAVLWVHNDTAIQRRASDNNRATVASFKNFGTELLAASVFLITWLFGDHYNTSLLYMIGGLLLLLMSIVLLFKYKQEVLSR